MKIAIIGSGVSGLACAHLLHPRHDVTVFESDGRAGGHANTVTVTLGSREHRVDTGFIVYNERNYPLFTRLLGQLDVDSRPSDMSFSVSDEDAGMEWSGSSLAAVFAQPANLARPSFLRMLADVARFNHRARALTAAPPNVDVTLGDFLADGGYSSRFVDWYLVPLAASIWSADPPTTVRHCGWFLSPKRPWLSKNLTSAAIGKSVIDAGSADQMEAARGTRYQSTKRDE